MNWLPDLVKLLGTTCVSTEPDQLAAHAGDAWFASHLPNAVVFAKSTEDVVHTLQFAHQHQIPVTARGAGRGYVGGCVPSHGGIVLSLIRMNRILEIHQADGVAIVQPGVVTGILQAAVAKKGLFYPPDPASLKECSLGGNIATNAGGPRCIKYGVTRNYVLGLEVVLADGTRARLGGRTMKNKTGFDLTGLFVGSEGMLGVVTEATLRLLPLPLARAGASASFSTATKAAAAVQKILGSGFIPSGLEVADQFTLEAARKHLGAGRVPPGKAQVLVEIDGHQKSVLTELADLMKLLKSCGALELKPARDAEACEKLWQLRREFSGSLKATGLTKLNEDVVVPRSRLVDLFKFGEKLHKKYGFAVACFGHAGDGNIHVNLMLDIEQPGAREASEQALDELFHQIVAWGGAVTGEHGIGLAKKPWWSIAADAGTREIHQRIKAALDPAALLNPGKFLDGK